MCTLETFKNRVLNLFNLKSGRLTAILTLNPETVKASEKEKQKARTRTSDGEKVRAEKEGTTLKCSRRQQSDV